MRKVTPAGKITTFAGIGKEGLDAGDGGPATSAELGLPDRAGSGRRGNVYIAERVECRAQGEPRRDDHEVRRHVRGRGLSCTSKVWCRRRPGYVREFAYPGGVAVDAKGNVYIAEGQDQRVRKVSPDGKIRRSPAQASWAFRGTAARRPRR